MSQRQILETAKNYEIKKKKMIEHPWPTTGKISLKFLSLNYQYSLTFYHYYVM